MEGDQRRQSDADIAHVHATPRTGSQGAQHHDQELSRSRPLATLPQDHGRDQVQPGQKVSGW